MKWAARSRNFDVQQQLNRLRSDVASLLSTLLTLGGCSNALFGPENAPSHYNGLFFILRNVKARKQAEHLKTMCADVFSVASGVRSSNSGR